MGGQRDYADLRGFWLHHAFYVCTGAIRCLHLRLLRFGAAVQTEGEDDRYKDRACRPFLGSFSSTVTRFCHDTKRHVQSREYSCRVVFHKLLSHGLPQERRHCLRKRCKLRTLAIGPQLPIRTILSECRRFMRPHLPQGSKLGSTGSSVVAVATTVTNTYPRDGNASIFVHCCLFRHPCLVWYHEPDQSRAGYRRKSNVLLRADLTGQNIHAATRLLQLLHLRPTAIQRHSEKTQGTSLVQSSTDSVLGK